MPTAARLVAGLALGAVSVAMVFVLMAFYPDERFDRALIGLVSVFGLVGFMVGWKSLGRQIAVEGGTGIGLGIRATITVALWVVLLLAIWYVVGEIMDGRLRGEKPMKAVFLGVDKATEYLLYLLNWKILAIGFFMGICVGVLTRNTHYKWR